MGKEIVNVIVEGGKATAGAQLGQTLGPLKVNIAEIVNKINEKTSSFKGIKVPVKVIVDTQTKEFNVEVGSPPVSELIKKEINIEKGSGEPNKKKIANLAIEQVIKIAKMKHDSMLEKTLKSAVKSIIGSCGTLGILVEGKIPVEINGDIDSGVFDKEIKAEKTEITQEKQDMLQQQLAEVQDRINRELEKLKALEEQEKKEVKVAEVKEEVKEGEEAEAGEEGKEGEAKEEGKEGEVKEAKPKDAKAAPAKDEKKKPEFKKK